MTKLKEIQDAKRIGVQDLADAVGTTRQTIGRLRSGSQKMTPEWARKLAKPLGVNPVVLLLDDPATAELAAVTPESITNRRKSAVINHPLSQSGPNLDDSVTVNEIDVLAGLGIGSDAPTHDVPIGKAYSVSRDNILAAYELPQLLVRGEMRARPEDLAIIRVVGDSMEPTFNSGDRVFVNTRDVMPSPGGCFAIHDGYGLAVKRLQIIPNVEPAALRVISDNTLHPEDTRSEGEIHIIGRVCGLLRTL